MKLLKFTVLSVTLFSLSLSIFSCKGKSSSSTADTTITAPPVDTTTVAPAPAPVQISADDSLTTMLKDATKDFPGVTATVSNGEVTLTGEIKREKLPKLMQSINATKPKKINNNLTIK